MGHTYRAFISYSHSDAAWARWLHARLETYRIPGGDAQLVSAGGRKGRLGPIFRDREELPAAQDLSTSVRAALAASEVLVVLCSPEARASSWVAREIEVFREVGPERPILCAIISGEPGEAFPEALTHGCEPLAADLRKRGDGRRLGFLKIVAGIAGVPLDTLVQRDGQRNLRRVTAITVASTAAALAMGIMTIIAFQSRDEARQQRAEAEGLVEYMLTDLPERLRGAGRLDLMAAVTGRALDYYRAQCEFDRLEADSLERCARGLHVVGEVDGSAGNWRGAQAKFELAHRATGELLGLEPEDPDRIFAHAQSEYWVGFSHWQQLDLAQAERYWRGYLALAERLAAVERGSVRSLMELGYANGNVCELLGRSAASMGIAFEHCREAIRFMQQAVDREPGNVRNVMALANRHGWLADALLRTGDFDRAIGERQAERRLLDDLAARDPADAEVRMRQAWPLIGLGEIELRRGRFDASLVALEEARSGLEALARRDPRNEDVAAFRIRTLMLAAKAGQGAGHADWRSYQLQARQIYDEASAGKDGEPVRRMRNLLEL